MNFNDFELNWDIVEESLGKSRADVIEEVMNNIGEDYCVKVWVEDIVPQLNSRDKKDVMDYIEETDGKGNIKTYIQENMYLFPDYCEDYQPTTFNDEELLNYVWDNYEDEIEDYMDELEFEGNPEDEWTRDYYRDVL